MTIREDREKVIARKEKCAKFFGKIGGKIDDVTYPARAAIFNAATDARIGMFYKSLGPKMLPVRVKLRSIFNAHPTQDFKITIPHLGMVHGTYPDDTSKHRKEFAKACQKHDIKGFTSARSDGYHTKTVITARVEMDKFQNFSSSQFSLKECLKPSV